MTVFGAQMKVCFKSVSFKPLGSLAFPHGANLLGYSGQEQGGVPAESRTTVSASEGQSWAETDKELELWGLGETWV
jgi:hypothetical protein